MSHYFPNAVVWAIDPNTFKPVYKLPDGSIVTYMQFEAMHLALCDILGRQHYVTPDIRQDIKSLEDQLSDSQREEYEAFLIVQKLGQKHV